MLEFCYHLLLIDPRFPKNEVHIVVYIKIFNSNKTRQVSWTGRFILYYLHQSKDYYTQI